MLLQTLIDDKIVKRSYSICSSNQTLQDEWIISFSIKQKEQGVFSTRSTQTAQPGMKIKMTWPLWKFVDPKSSRNYLFVSVGSGLSPCWSLYQWLLVSQDYDKIANLFGERYFSHVPQSVLDSYHISSPHIYHQLCLSKDDQFLADPLIRNGYVQDALDDALEFLDSNNITVFICGLPVMCNHVKDILLAKWFAKEQLIIEKY